MLIAVTGGTGFVGSHSVKALLDAGHQVRLLVRSPQKVGTSLAPLGIGEDDVEVAVADVTDPAAITAGVTGTDAMLHAASVYTLDPTRAEEVAETNAAGVRNVIGASIEAGLDPIVHVSSVVALLREESVGETLTANSPVGNSPHTYPASKAEQEAHLRGLQLDGHPIVLTYPGGVWGPNDPYDGESQSVARAALRGMYTFVPPGRIPIVDVRDVAAVHAAAMTSGLGPRRFMAGGRGVPLRRMVSLVGSALGRPRPSVTVPRAMAGPFARAGDWLRTRGTDIGVGQEALWISDRQATYDNGATEEALGVSFRPVEQTIADQMRWMRREGRL